MTALEITEGIVKVPKGRINIRLTQLDGRFYRERGECNAG